MLKTDPPLSLSRAKELFVVRKGVLQWRIPRQGISKKRTAGCLNAHGYVVVRADYVLYRAHHIIWLLHYGVWPKMQLDHRNGVRDDNRISNLRELPQKHNLQNVRKARTDSGTGLLGASPHGNGYKALITVDGKRHYIGYFKTPEAAHAAYKKAKRRLHVGGTL